MEWASGKQVVTDTSLTEDIGADNPVRNLLRLMEIVLDLCKRRVDVVRTPRLGC